jgi:hypothetical protein
MGWSFIAWSWAHESLRVIISTLELIKYQLERFHSSQEDTGFRQTCSTDGGTVLYGVKEREPMLD